MFVHQKFVSEVGQPRQFVNSVRNGPKYTYLKTVPVRHTVTADPSQVPEPRVLKV